MSLRKHCSSGLLWISVLSVAALVVALVVPGAQAAMKEAKKETISGKLIDLSCASKGKAMMDSWANVEQDHMMPDGQTAKGCATMCLKGGQPAALFSGDKIAAVFACSPRFTLADFAAQDVDVQGFWAGGSKDAVKTFVPEKIRAKGGSGWTDVACAEMHE